ncbi:MAG: tandem-95 repeat protein [Pseudomonadota bacterium]
MLLEAWDGVLRNDSVAEGESLTALLVAGPGHGTLDLHADGSFTYTPASNFNGMDSFTYKAHDGAADSEITTVNLWVTSVNDTPVAQAGSFATAEDTAILIPRGGYDVDGDILTSTWVTTPSHGTLSPGALGVTYTPDPDWHGTDSFTYKVNDGQVDSNIGTVSITVSRVNDPPALDLGGVAGSLDQTFGTGGKALMDIIWHSESDPEFAVAIQSDGKIVVVGSFYNATDEDFAVVRYNSDGTLDPGFGSNGMVLTDVSGVGSLDYASSVAIDSDGKIVVAGTSYNGTDKDFAVVRYNYDGSLDTSFGTGGKALTDVSGVGSWDYAYSVATQSDGKVVVAGTSYDGSDQDFAVVRYNYDGSLDESFGTGMKALTDVSGAGSLDYAYSVAIQPDGKIVVAGTSYDGSDQDFAVVRYNHDGSLDASFGYGGKALTDVSGVGNLDYAYSVAIDSDGKIVVGGTSHNGSDDDFTVVRYNNDGHLDTSFGYYGKAVTDASGVESWDYGYSVAIQSDGKIVVAGQAFTLLGSDFTVVRFNHDGSLDTNFGTGGKALTDVSGVGSWDYAYSVAIQSDGQIVLAGNAFTESGSDLAVVRYNAGPEMHYVENSGPQIVDSTITLTDPDSHNMAYATIQITGNYHSAEDSLGIAQADLVSGVTASWDGTTGKLTLTGSATTADYEAMLEHVTYINSGNNPETDARTVTWTVNDGALDSVPKVSDIDVTAINDPPTISSPVLVETPEDSLVSLTGSNAIVISDAENDQITVALTINHGILTAGEASGPILWLMGTPAQVNTVLAGLKYTPTANYNGPDSINVVVWESLTAEHLTASSTTNVTVTPVNDAPRILIINNPPTSATAGTTVDLQTVFRVEDVDGDNLTFQLTALSNGLPVDTLNIDSGGGSAEITRDSNNPNSLISVIGSPEAINMALSTLSESLPPSFTGNIYFSSNVSDGIAPLVNSETSPGLTVNAAQSNTPNSTVVNNPVTAAVAPTNQSGTPSLVDAPLSSSGTVTETNTSVQLLSIEVKITQSAPESTTEQPANVAAVAAAAERVIQEQQAAEQKVVEQQVTEQKAVEQQKVVEQYQLEKQQAAEQQKVVEQAEQTKSEAKAEAKEKAVEKAVEKTGSEHAATLVGVQVAVVSTGGHTMIMIYNPATVAAASGGLVGTTTQLDLGTAQTMSVGSFTQYLAEAAKAAAASSKGFSAFELPPGITISDVKRSCNECTQNLSFK